MNKSIRTYEDLLQEEQRLISRLRTQEEVLKRDMAGVKAGLQPLNKVVKMANKFSTRDNTAPVINFGLEFGIDLFIRRFLLARAGWFTKILVPFLMKNYSSHIIGEEKREALLKKVRSMFQKLRPEADPAPSPQSSAGSK